MEEDLIRLGYTTIESLRNVDPEALYERDCTLRGCRIDRCQLYVYRCAVYFASTEEPDPKKLKWWSWKDQGALPDAEEKGTGGHAPLRLSKKYVIEEYLYPSYSPKEVGK